MSEYWVSKKKYWCQYCEIYIADDAPSRSQHENGMRHKGNKDRFIRSLYKAGIKKKQDGEEEKREMKRVEEAAQAAYARDVGAGLVGPIASSSTAPLPTPKSNPPRPKPSDPYANYTTAASLGITDPDVDRLVAEAQVRQSEGRAGDWITVVPPPPPLPAGVDGDIMPVSDGSKLDQEGALGTVRSRVEEPVDEDDTRRFKMRKKTVPLGLGEIYDPGVIRVKPRVEPDVKQEPVSIFESTPMSAVGPILGAEATQTNTGPQTVESIPKATDKPTWIRREWKWAGEDQEEGSNRVSLPEGTLTDANPNSTAHPDNVPNENLFSDKENEVKKEDTHSSGPLSESPVGGSMFRKRKITTGSNKGRRQV
ncbi:hypothetical protein K439DRAFT_579913 [Ramaria rubella]|nr:hypothetical protein K439DRAFT_579913 [Ramaria rubella]